MTPRETELFEAELGQLQPNKLPRDLAERLVAARPSLDPPPHPSPTLAPMLDQLGTHQEKHPETDTDSDPEPF